MSSLHHGRLIYCRLGRRKVIKANLIPTITYEKYNNEKPFAIFKFFYRGQSKLSFSFASIRNSKILEAREIGLFALTLSLETLESFHFPGFHSNKQSRKRINVETSISSITPLGNALPTPIFFQVPTRSCLNLLEDGFADALKIRQAFPADGLRLLEVRDMRVRKVLKSRSERVLSRRSHRSSTSTSRTVDCLLKSPQSLLNPIGGSSPHFLSCFMSLGSFP